MCQAHRPACARLVPGYLRAGAAAGRRLPHYEVWWDDQASGADAVIRRRWVAESAKRYLAAQIAVGTVDQAMMAALTVRHAHMRAAYRRPPAPSHGAADPARFGRHPHSNTDSHSHG